MNITFIGSGYVGLTTGTCFAEVGHHVLCVDNNKEKVQTLLDGHIPIFEPGLEQLVTKNVASGRLNFTTDTNAGVKHGDVIFIAVPTPPQPDGSVDLSFIEKVAREISENLTPDLGYRVIVDKSTVPVKTGEKVAETIRRYAPEGVEFGVVSNPEFLREGCAVDDLMMEPIIGDSLKDSVLLIFGRAFCQMYDHRYFSLQLGLSLVSGAH
jgi:UDPglucose 6-dehydrogenase